jgi:hypothetical protein
MPQDLTVLELDFQAEAFSQPAGRPAAAKPRQPTVPGDRYGRQRSRRVGGVRRPKRFPAIGKPIQRHTLGAKDGKQRLGGGTNHTAGHVDIRAFETMPTGKRAEGGRESGAADGWGRTGRHGQSR